MTNNITETFNSWIRNEKSLNVVDLMVFMAVRRGEATYPLPDA